MVILRIFPYTVISLVAKMHGANVGPIWGRQDTGGPHVGHMNLYIWDILHIKAVKIIRY